MTPGGRLGSEALKQAGSAERAEGTIRQLLRSLDLASLQPGHSQSSQVLGAPFAFREDPAALCLSFPTESRVCIRVSAEQGLQAGDGEATGWEPTGAEAELGWRPAEPWEAHT